MRCQLRMGLERERPGRATRTSAKPRPPGPVGAFLGGRWGRRSSEGSEGPVRAGGRRQE